LAAEARISRQFAKRGLVRHRPPQPRWHAILFDLLQPCRDAGLAEVFLRENVGCDLAPVRGHIETLERKNDRAVGILDLGGGAAEGDRSVRRNAGLREAPRNLHSRKPPRSIRAGRDAKWPSQPAAMFADARLRKDPGDAALLWKRNYLYVALRYGRPRSRDLIRPATFPPPGRLPGA